MAYGKIEVGDWGTLVLDTELERRWSDYPEEPVKYEHRATFSCPSLVLRHSYPDHIDLQLFLMPDDYDRLDSVGLNGLMRTPFGVFYSGKRANWADARREDGSIVCGYPPGAFIPWDR